MSSRSSSNEFPGSTIGFDSTVGSIGFDGIVSWSICESNSPFLIAFMRGCFPSPHLKFRTFDC